MMQQYLQLKAAYPDCLLLYRLGDFYEMFLEDAKEGARILDITLTSRSRGRDGRIPMAGVPYHALDNYLYRLVQAGKKVAICEQVSEPGRGLVERAVVRIVTPGTVLDEKNLEQKKHLYILFLAFGRQRLAAAAADLSTGQLLVSELDVPELSPFPKKRTSQAVAAFEAQYRQAVLTPLQTIASQLQPAEVVISPMVQASAPLAASLRTVFPQVSVDADWLAKLPDCHQRLQRQFGSASQSWPQLQTELAVQATAALLRYLESTQKMAIPHIQPPQDLLAPQQLRLDPSTVANLELFQSLRSTPQFGPQARTLIEVIDRTRTPMGGRLLKQWLRQPLVSLAAIQDRHDQVEFWVKQPESLQQLHRLLQQFTDLERLSSRIVLQLGSPKDLRGLVQLLNFSWAVRQQLLELDCPFFAPVIAAISPSLLDLRDQLDRTLLPDPAFDPRQGGVIADGIDAQLDQLRTTVRESQSWIAQLESQERQKTGISSLKIRFNQVFGFYIEVSRANIELVPTYFLRKQTLVNAERFITPELKEHEEIILTARAQTDAIELQLFNTLVTAVQTQIQAIQAAAHAIASLDCLAGLAELALHHRYVRPEMVTDGQLVITAGRHPVVEELLEASFVPNDVRLNPTAPQLLLLTGPNMAGKSVLMRQVALIVILAHLGAFVPADRAIIPLTDRVFVRSGAADMITAGLSTFMVEMVETAQILRAATADSLVIMDEIGRGTSTYDGISIAWAVAEQLLSQARGPKTLFATHYHELQALAHHFPLKVANAHMAVTEQAGKPVFLYTLTPGGASHSYGLAVAELAGVPASVNQRARQLLIQLEHGQHLLDQATTVTAAPLAVPVAAKRGRSRIKVGTSSEVSAVPGEPVAAQLRRALQQLDLNQTTPLAALAWLSTWQAKLAAAPPDHS